jgi:hypothetical protein
MNRRRRSPSKPGNEIINERIQVSKTEDFPLSGKLDLTDHGGDMIREETF